MPPGPRGPQSTRGKAAQTECRQEAPYGVSLWLQVTVHECVNWVVLRVDLMSEGGTKGSCVRIQLSHLHKVYSFIQSTFVEHLSRLEACAQLRAFRWMGPLRDVLGVEAFGKAIWCLWPESPWKARVVGIISKALSPPATCEWWLGSLTLVEMGTGLELWALVPGSGIRAQPGCLLCLIKPESVSQA